MSSRDEHAVGVHAVEEALGEQRRDERRPHRHTRPRPRARAHRPRASTASPARIAMRRQRGQQPAAEEALLRSHVHDEDERPRDEEQRSAHVLGESAHSARDSCRERHPAEPPRQHPQVIEKPRVVVEAELSEAGRRLLLPAHVRPELVERQQRVRVRQHEAQRLRPPMPTTQRHAWLPVDRTTAATPRRRAAGAPRSRPCTSWPRPGPARRPRPRSRRRARASARPRCRTRTRPAAAARGRRSEPGANRRRAGTRRPSGRGDEPDTAVVEPRRRSGRRTRPRPCRAPPR